MVHLLLFAVALTDCSGLRDNGYVATINELLTDGFSHKLIFLRGYDEIASQFRTMIVEDEISLFTIPGVFLTEKC